MKIRNQLGLSWFVIMVSLGGIGRVGWAIQAEEKQATAAASSKKPPLPVERPLVAPQPATKFLRLLTDEYQEPVALQTATARYVKLDDKGKVQFEVLLESVIHVGDTSYFRGFQKRFERYDRVLYESVFKEEKREPTDELPSGFRMLQQLSIGTLGLAYQYEEIDYKANNLTLADLSPAQIEERMKERGDDQTVLLADMLTHLIKKMSEATAGEPATTETSSTDTPVARQQMDPKELISVFTDPDGIMKIRRWMATGLVGSGLLESSLPSSVHKMIIGDRNDRVLSMLEDEIKKGSRRIAVFYGVGNMADLERRLIGQLGLKRANVNWRNAWDLRDGAVEGAPLEGLLESTFRDSFKSKLRRFAKGLRNKKDGSDAAVPTQSDKDQKIKEMEQSLEALRARLKEMERKAEEKDKESKKSDGDETRS